MQLKGLLKPIKKEKESEGKNTGQKLKIKNSQKSEHKQSIQVS